MTPALMAKHGFEDTRQTYSTVAEILARATNPRGWIAVDDACQYPDAETLQADLAALDADGLPFPVSAWHCSNTPHVNAAYNHAARAWHDRVHAELSADFDTLAEIRVSIHQWRQVESYARRFKLQRCLTAMCALDNYLPTIYMHAFGRFPSNHLHHVRRLYPLASQSAGRLCQYRTITGYVSYLADKRDKA